jgi:hypothetical protein
MADQRKTSMELKPTTLMSDQTHGVLSRIDIDEELENIMPVHDSDARYTSRGPSYGNPTIDGTRCKNISCFRGLLLFLPISILLWLFIIWGIKSLLF